MLEFNFLMLFLIVWNISYAIWSIYDFFVNKRKDAKKYFSMGVELGGLKMLDMLLTKVIDRKAFEGDTVTECLDEFKLEVPSITDRIFSK